MKRAWLSSSFAAIILVCASPALAQGSPGADPTEAATDEAGSPATAASAPALPAPPPAEQKTVIVASSDAPSSPDRTPAEGAPRYDLVRINMGLRVGHQPAALTGYAPSRGFDAFASNDVLAQFSIDSTIPIVTRGRLVLGAGLGWDVGGRSATVRGLDSSLTAHRLYVPIEGRYHLGAGLFVFGKVAPGAIAAIASVKDGSSPNELSGTGWAFSGDASIGGSILLGPRQHMDRRIVRFWLTPEIGYSYTTSAPIRLNPNRAESDVLGSDENTQLGRLALSGIFWRASVGTTF
jgi:hypothetical protein